jgi:hypothetical protein
MPSARITTGEWARGRELELLDALHSAMVDGIKIPDWDRDVIVEICGDKARVSPPNRTARYTRIEIILYVGRSLEAKRSLYKAIVKNMGALGVEPTDLKTLLIEIPLEDCAPHGAEPASDIQDLGYAVKV